VRYSGEEFVLLRPPPYEAALRVAEKTRQTVERLVIQHAISNAEPMVTLSLEGASFISDLLTDPRTLTEPADKALYQAKEPGRYTTVSGRAGLYDLSPSSPAPFFVHPKVCRETTMTSPTAPKRALPLLRYTCLIGTWCPSGNVGYTQRRFHMGNEQFFSTSRKSSSCTEAFDVCAAHASVWIDAEIG
jgi:hypothetical protein